jgi:hypothetical protein
VDFLIILFAVWWLGAFVTYVVLFKRFIVRNDIRRPRNVDEFDLFGPVVGIFLIIGALVVLNPVRWAHVVGKSLGWPVTLYLRFAGQRAPTVADASPGDPAPPEPDPADPPTTPLAALDIAAPTPAGAPSSGVGARKPTSSPGSVLSALPHPYAPTSRRP